VKEATADRAVTVTGAAGATVAAVTTAALGVTVADATIADRAAKAEATAARAGIGKGATKAPRPSSRPRS
jgi:hypothetical protein